MKSLKDYTIEDCLDHYEDGFHIVCGDGRIKFISNAEDDEDHILI